jgi:hypothetical protein
LKSIAERRAERSLRKLAAETGADWLQPERVRAAAAKRVFADGVRDARPERAIPAEAIGELAAWVFAKLDEFQGDALAIVEAELADNENLDLTLLATALSIAVVTIAPEWKRAVDKSLDRMCALAPGGSFDDIKHALSTRTDVRRVGS